MSMDLELPPMISWKEKLLGVGSVDSIKDHLATGDGKDRDLVLLEGDVIRPTINGIPRIDFSDKIKQILYKEIETIVVSKLLGQSIGYNALHNRISSFWKLSKPFQLMDFENSYYLVKFQCFDDYEKVLT
ncbi:hypothetical protein PVK06_035753 [Gossypium arboreum]|uniref:DUF4283 domain-containing protein n=1 Tax=Gossypium arboreum TaxID=29729 RepID=A0ABR0NIL2_GOSAR|nr:hypothetical protein PVK06_035753 [Gossypium arboreum]